MFKKPINLFIVLIIVLINYSCDKKVKPTKATTVNIIKTVQTSTFNKVKTGSFLDWKASHLGGVSPRIGKIYYKNATILVNSGKVTNASFVIDMTTMTVDNLPDKEAKDLLKHLQSSDFFDINKHQTSKFELTNLENIQGEYNSKITGNLTMLGVSKSISFNANIAVSENEVSITSENFILDRSDWGLTYHKKGTKGVPLDYLISDDILFKVAISVTK